MDMAKIAGRKCPKCMTVVLPGREKCPRCGLPVAQMDSLDAKIDTARRQKQKAVEAAAATPFWKSPVMFAGLFLLLLIGVGLYFAFGRPKPEPWRAYPTTREAAVRQLMEGIATGKDEGYLKSYAVVAQSMKDPKNSDEEGQYRQVFHELYKYLSGEFGPDFGTTMTIEQDPQFASGLIVHVGLETLHVGTDEQTPPELIASAGDHYGVSGFSEFNMQDAASMQQAEAITGYLKLYGAQGSINQLQSIAGASESRRMTAWQRKVSILPIVRNPRTVTRQAIIRLWPIRKDPVVKARLESIAEDGRYDNLIQQTAREVVNEKVSEEELIAVGVAD
jgi:hypothetical protein